MMERAIRMGAEDESRKPNETKQESALAKTDAMNISNFPTLDPNPKTP